MKSQRKFKTKRAKGRYESWEPIITKAKRDGVPKETIRMMEEFRDSWIGK